MPRAIWKGAISFGLVHVPVALYPASQETGIDFDWLDKRSMDPVGYKRINKRTGKEIANEHIVKGIKQDDGNYVILSDDEIKAAFPSSTQSIDIEAFVEATQIPPILFERPYYLEPLGKGAKVYALLREAMLETAVIGIARVVMHTKEHLAALIPSGPVLLLNTIRWASEIRPIDELKLPAAGKAAASLKPGELKMALQLIHTMTSAWKGEHYTDTFTAAVQKLVDHKLKAGQTHVVTPLEDAPSQQTTSNVIDLTELLAKSLEKRRPATAAKSPGVETTALRGTTTSAKKTAKRATRKRA